MCLQMQNGNHPSCLPTPGAGVKVNGLVFLLAFSSWNILAQNGLTRSPSDLPSPRCCTTCTPQHKSWSWLGPLGFCWAPDGHTFSAYSVSRTLSAGNLCLSADSSSGTKTVHFLPQPLPWPLLIITDFFLFNLYWAITHIPK